MDLVYLIEFVIAREKWEEGKNLKEYTTDTPYIHLVAVMAVGH